MPTPFEDLYAAAKAIMADANTAATWTTLTQAPSNYGTDFRIPVGDAWYQVRLSLVESYARSSNDSHPRAIVVVAINHRRDDLADEEEFLHKTMPEIATNRLLLSSIWAAESGVFGLQDDPEPEVSEGERIGNVITFEVSAVVLADAV